MTQEYASGVPIWRSHSNTRPADLAASLVMAALTGLSGCSQGASSPTPA